MTPGQNARNGCAFGLQFGSGPVSMTIGHRGDPGDGTVILGATQLPGWYALENVWLSGPGYQGPFMVRGQRLDRPGRLRRLLSSHGGLRRTTRLKGEHERLLPHPAWPDLDSAAGLLRLPDRRALLQRDDSNRRAPRDRQP